MNSNAEDRLKQLDNHLQSRSSQLGLDEAYQDCERIKQHMRQKHQRILPNSDIKQAPQANCGI
jgi:uncharacterized membrane-anchored protein YhcB (DUF1043 family)